MNIPLKSAKQRRPPLELCSIKLYSTGLKKVFTKHFYKSMNHNFGVEILVRNNTQISQTIHVGGCIYNNNGKEIINWKNVNITISPQSYKKHDFFVKEFQFANMNEGTYKVQFWINNKRVQREFFTISYK